jgi:hypothetical protein
MNSELEQAIKAGRKRYVNNYKHLPTYQWISGKAIAILHSFCKKINYFSLKSADIETGSVVNYILRVP